MYNKIITLLSLITLTTGLSFGATVSDLQNREQELYHIIGEYWIDDLGDLHLSNKELGTPKFVLTEAFMKRLTGDQIKASINTAMSRFTPEQKDEYLQAITPFLDDLVATRNELKGMRNKLDSSAATLATYLGKTVQTVMQMPTTNIKNLVSVLPGEKKADLTTKINIEEFNNLRTAFNIDTKMQKPSSSKGNVEASFESTTLPAHLKAGGKSSSGKNIINYGADDTSSDESD
jgi:hypothetical protein